MCVGGGIPNTFEFQTRIVLDLADHKIRLQLDNGQQRLNNATHLVVDDIPAVNLVDTDAALPTCGCCYVLCGRSNPKLIVDIAQNIEP